MSHHDISPSLETYVCAVAYRDHVLMTYLPLNQSGERTLSISRKWQIRVTSKFVLSYEICRSFGEGLFGPPLARDITKWFIEAKQAMEGEEPMIIDRDNMLLRNDTK